jgi:hypothetical protein
MDLERGMLARLDRRLMAGLDREERFQMVRVPVTPATWSTWKRYCDIAGISMGRAISALVDHELAAVVGETPDRVFDLQSGLEERASRLDVRERELDERENRLRRSEDELREREARLRHRTDSISAAVTGVRVGRTEACPCGSGFKYKRCHGQPV